MTPALSLYLIAAARAEPLVARGARERGARAPRDPDTGSLVWIHLGTGELVEGATSLASRIADERPETGFVVTSDDPTDPDVGLAWNARPIDFPKAVAEFLTAWMPTAAVWIGGPVWPVLASTARKNGIPTLLVNATEALVASHRGIPARDLLGLFERIEACTQRDRKALERVTRRPVGSAGRLQRSTRPLDHDESERMRLAHVLQARPVWFAAGATVAELEALRAAHAIGLSASHRLLLIVRPTDSDATSALLEAHVPRRSEGEGAPPPGAPLFLADEPDEDGLWYHIASISFIGGTLGGPTATTDPFEAAALGSAVLHGPVLAPYETHFSALRAAGASRSVSSADELGRAVETLLAPDRAADLAQRGWTVISDGAEATDHVAEEVVRLLDARP